MPQRQGGQRKDEKEDVNEVKRAAFILVSDANCHDCKGPVTLFGIPDKVWKGLGLTTEWVCISCVMHRLNPAFSSAATAYDLSKEIHRQRKRFKLKAINRICGQRAPAYAVVMQPENESCSTLTKKEIMGST
jgi:hypothetical protein